MAKIREDILLFGGMNLDSAILEKGDYLAAQNCLNSKAKSGNKGEIENVPGNTYVASSYIISSLPGSSHCIGWCHDYENKGILMFFYNDEGWHCIVRYNIATQEVEKVLFPDTSNKVSQTLSLNFQPENEVFDAFVIDGKLYWTDNYNPPRKINLEKAYNWSNSVVVAVGKSYATITSSLLDRIKKPPMYAPTVAYKNDVLYNRNNLKGKLYQFCYRYIYDDYEKSVASNISIIPLPIAETYYDGRWVENVSQNNTISIKINTGSEDVRKIEIFTRNANTETGGSVVYGNFYAIKEINKFDEDHNQIVSNNIELEYLFRNDTPIYAVDQTELLRPFDYVPLLSGSMCVIDGNKIIDGNYLEGYDRINLNTKLTANNIEINSYKNITLLITDIVGYATYLGPTVDDIIVYGRVFLPTQTPEAGDVINLLVSDGVNVSSHLYTITSAHVANYPTLLKDNIIAQLTQDGIVIPTIPDTTNDYLIPVNQYTGSFPVPSLPSSTVEFAINFYATSRNWDIEGNITIFDTNKYLTIKEGTRVKVGILYSDDAKRCTSIITNESMEVEIPFVNETNPNKRFLTYLTLNISNLAPEWATSYSIVWFPRASILESFQFWYKLNKPSGVDEGTHDIRFDGTLLQYRIRINNRISEHNTSVPKSIIPQYIWKKGDRIRFKGSIDTQGTYVYIENDIDLEIIGAEDYTDGDEVFYEIILENFDFEGNKLFNDGTSLYSGRYGVWYEIYTPALNIEEKIGYRIAVEYPIVNRYHQANSVNQTAQLAAQLILTGKELYPNSSVQPNFGDSYIFSRAIFHNNTNPAFSSIILPVSSMHFSDFYQSDVYTLGLPGVVSDTIRQKRYTSGLRYSNSLVQESQINGLSTIEYSSYHILNESFGRVMKMEQVGDAIKIRQELKSTSFYVGKSFLKTATGQNVPVEAQDRVLGAKVVSNDSYGLAHPYSYIVYNRHEYFFDVRNGVVIRDSANGMFEISGYGMQSFFKELGALIYNNPSIYRIRAGYDTLNDLYILLVHNISNRIKSVPYILAFHEKTNKWKTFLTHYYKTDLLSYESPQMYTFFGDVMLSARDEGIWRHNEGTNNTFYGQFNPSFITVRSQAEFDKAKTFESIGVNSNKYWYAPSFDDIQIDPTITYPRGMRSRLKQGKFTHKEGMLWAAFMNNAVTHQATPTEDDLVNGDNLRGRTMDIKLWNYDTEDVSLLNIVVMSNPSGML